MMAISRCLFRWIRRREFDGFSSSSFSSANLIFTSVNYLSVLHGPQKSRPIERLTFEECPIITLRVHLSVRGQLAKVVIPLKPGYTLISFGMPIDTDKIKPIRLLNATFL